MITTAYSGYELFGESYVHLYIVLDNGVAMLGRSYVFNTKKLVTKFRADISHLHPSTFRNIKELCSLPHIAFTVRFPYGRQNKQWYFPVRH
jgi:hypothetical protein